MSYFIRKVGESWTFLRSLRLILGIVFAVNGLMESSPVIILFGSLLAVQGLLNFGCGACASGGCQPHLEEKAKEVSKVEYEMVSDNAH